MGIRSKFFLVCLLTACTTLLSGPRANAAQVHGVLTVVKGKVAIKSGKSGKEERAKVGMKVYPKDAIITQDDARAKIVMVDKNELNVSPNSQIVIEAYEFDPSKDKKNVLIDVLYGKVRSKVEQKYDGEDNKFQVKTPSAVAGVRGTDFFTSFSKTTNTTKIVTFKGEVAFGLPGPNGSILNPVAVKVGQFTVSSGSAPSPPMAMPQTELAQFDMETKADSPEADKRTPAGDVERRGGKQDENKPESKQEGSQPDQGNNRDKGPGGDQAKDNPPKQAGNDPQPDKGKDGDNRQGGKSDQGGKPNQPGKSDQAKGGPGQNDARPNGAPGSQAGNGPKGPGGSNPDMKAPQAGTAPGRQPAGMMPPPPMGGTGMMRPEDFASAPTMPGFVGMPPPPMMPFLPPPIPGSNIICEFCREVIQNGTTRLIIRVTNGAAQ